MKRNIRTAALVLSLPVPVLVLILASLSVTAAMGCGDDAASASASAEAGSTQTEAGSTPMLDSGAPVPDGSLPTACGNAQGAPPRLLLTLNRATTSELSVFNIGDRKVDGRFTYPGFVGTTSSLGADPFVVEQANDVVAKMNAQRPWEPVASWNVVGDDNADGGDPNAQPVAIVVPTCTKGYVLRYNRNKIAVLDTSRASDGGVPERYIDLSAFVQPEDTDGLVEMTAAVYVPSRKRIYVVLGNYDRFAASRCKNTRASVIAIDEATGNLVSLGGTAPGGGIALEGYSPVLGAPLIYDAVRDRLLITQSGCLSAGEGVEAGPTIKSGIEEVDLATGRAKTLIELNEKGFPSQFIFANATRAAIVVTYPNVQTFFWDPSSSSLGRELPIAFGAATYDGKGNVVGLLNTPAVDGGAAAVSVVSVPLTADAGADTSSVTKLADTPFSTPPGVGFFGGAEIWPHL